MAFLINELRLSERRELLKDILERAVPITFQDVVVIFCTVTGLAQRAARADERRPQDLPRSTIDGENWSAIQITTAAGVCAVVDLHVAGQSADSAASCGRSRSTSTTSSPIDSAGTTQLDTPRPPMSIGARAECPVRRPVDSTTL